MKKNDKGHEEEDLRPEYDFTKLGKPIRGKHAAQFREGTNLVLLEPDVAKVFPNDASVNEALRFLIRIAEQRPSAP